jgi:hypothetical protein
MKYRLAAPLLTLLVVVLAACAAHQRFIAGPQRRDPDP